MMKLILIMKLFYYSLFSKKFLANLFHKGQRSIRCSITKNENEKVKPTLINILWHRLLSILRHYLAIYVFSQIPIKGPIEAIHTDSLNSKHQVPGDIKNPLAEMLKSEH